MVDLSAHLPNWAALDGACTTAEILEVELVVLTELKWALSPMTSIAWMRLFKSLYSGFQFSRAMQAVHLFFYKSSLQQELREITKTSTTKQGQIRRSKKERQNYT